MLGFSSRLVPALVLGAALLAGALEMNSLLGESGPRGPATPQRLPFLLSTQPGTQTLSPGDTAAYSIGIDRGPNLGAIQLGVTGLPRGAKASFEPQRPTGAASQLTINTSASRTLVGTYRITVSGKSARSTAQTTAVLDIAPPTSVAAFTISGSLNLPFYPGGGGPLDLTLTNPADRDIAVTRLTAAVTQVRAPNAGPSRPCTAQDFAVDQFSGAYPLRVGTSATSTLTALGVAAADLPALRMLNTADNQDGCKNADLTLTYTGTAKEAH